MKTRFRLILAALIAIVLIATVTVIGVIASDSTPTLTVKAANVSFEGTVHLYYAVANENIENPEDIKLLVWGEDEVSHVDECTLENAKSVLSPTPGKTLTVDEMTCAIFDYEKLAAAEMTKNVYARAYAEVDGEAIYSPVVKYSILRYSLNKMGITGSGTDNTALKLMLREMLEYGAAAQMYFFPESEAPLATDNFVKINAEGGTFADGTTTSLVRVGDEVTIYASVTEDKPHAMWYLNGKQVSANTNLTVKATTNASYSASISNIPSSFGKYEHVVIIGVDGAGAFNAPTPYIDEIFADGSLTRTMRVTSPTSSAASWASMLHGALPMHTRVYENSVVEDVNATYPIDSLFPSFFKVIVDEDPDAKVAVYSGWSGITNGIMEDENLVNIPQTRDSDVNNVPAVKNYIAENKDFKALFLQLNNVDAAGHNNGYVSDAYTAAITTADGQIGEIYAALESAGILDTTLFVVTADHGGVNRTDGSGTGTHGGLSDSEKYVLFAAAGHTVEKNSTGAVDMQIRDVAAISLYALGFAQPESYTARVPSGVFEGVEAGERPVFNDPTNYRDPVSLPTPEYNGADFITNKIDNDLMVYLPFDGSTNELASGNKVTEVDTITYENGYFGDAVVLDDGHLVMDNFAPGTESFTVSMWVKSPSPEGVPPIIASRDRKVGGSSKGFLLAMRRTASSAGTAFTLEWSAAANGTNAPDSYSNPYYLPDDFYMGWFHVTCIVDRESATITLTTDFGEFKTYNVGTYIASGLDLTNELKKLVFGDDLSENYSSKMGLSIDEFMIFKGALTRSEVNRLAEYYGKEGVPTIGDYVGIDPTLQLDFNGNVVNKGSDDATFDNTNMNYVDSPFGEAGDFTSVDQTKNTPEYWANSSDYTFSKEQAGGGYNDLTFSFWLSMQTDMMLDDLTGTQWTAGDRIVFATHDYQKKSTIPGMSLFLYAKPTKVLLSDLLKISYMNSDDYIADASGYAMYASGEFEGEYVYRQLLRIRASAMDTAGKVTEQDIGAYFYAPLCGWTNLTIVIDRGEYGVNDGVVKFYQDGQLLEDLYGNNTFAINDVIEDYGSLAGVDSSTGEPYGLMINDDIGHYPRDMESYLDEFVVFDRALTEEDLAKLAAYYEAIKDTQ